MRPYGLRLPRTLHARFLLALVLIGLLPLGLVGLGGALLQRQVIAEQSARELTGLARGLAAQVDSYLDPGPLSDARALASLPDVASMDPARQEAALRHLFLQYTAFSRLAVFDREGRRVAAAQPDGAVSVADQASFQTAIQRGEPTWEVAPALGNGRLSLVIHAPIRDARREVVGVLRGTVDMATLANVVNRTPVGSGGRVLVVDRAGRALIHPDPAAVQAHRDYSALGLWSGGRPAGPGVVRHGEDDESWVAGYAPIASTGWTVIVERPEAEVLAPAERSWQLALVGLAASAALAILGAALLARWLTSPLQELAVAASALGRGDPDVALPASGRAGDEVSMLVGAFGGMREAVREREAQAQAAIRARDEFLSIAAHELRTPVAGLKGNAQVLLRALRRGPLEQERLERTLGRMNDSADRLTTLIQDLLDVSRIRLGQLALRPERVDLAALVHGVAERYHEHLDDQHPLTVAAEGAAPVWADADRLEQVLTNLVDNAIKYSPGGGAVRVAVEAADGGVLLSVADPGIGLPPGTEELIFEPFGRAPNAAERQLPGMGLGLYICRSIVERHGGRIWAESTGDGKGTTMRVWLPGEAPAS